VFSRRLARWWSLWWEHGVRTGENNGIGASRRLGPACLTPTASYENGLPVISNRQPTHYLVPVYPSGRGVSVGEGVTSGSSLSVSSPGGMG
jgi:hypothetical protein